MRHFDLNPLYRNSVGFDRLFRLVDQAANPDVGSTYPPYNIEQTSDDAYRISMAVAGFKESELTLEIHDHILTVRGEKAPAETDPSRVLYRGIAARTFERRFQLANHVEVKAAHLENGLLHIELLRETPEALKPRRIPIGADQCQELTVAA